MNRKSPRELEDERRLAERAAEWVATLPEASAQERAEFVQWIKDSPQHLQEFLMASAVVRGLGQMDISEIPQVRELLAAEAANVVRLAPVSVEEGAAVLREKRRFPWRLAAGIAILAIALFAGRSLWFGGAQTYVTSVGEQHTFHLSDGSVVQLNVGSRIEVRLTDRARDIQLVAGEAMFKVGHDPARPFRVYTETTVIQALGTQFNVRRQPSGTTVSVIEGLVQISDEPVAKVPAPERLKAGEEARIGRDGKVEQRAAIDVQTVAAWRQNRLDFRADKLIDIAAEFNRYNETPQIVVRDESVGERRYSGVFDAHDPRALADFLREDSGLAIEDREASIVIRAR